MLYMGTFRTGKSLSLKFSAIFFTLGCAFGFGACQWEKKTEASVLVLAVESLSVDSVDCMDAEDQADQENGFQALCRESIRFSHAFTPSPMSQPALVSLLTGMWPFEHGVRDNGPGGLSAKVNTVAETALGKGYRTSFFSGGAPIFRQSGLAQGFEVFEDTLPLKGDRLSRDLNENFRLFKQWYKSDVDGKKFFSVVYLPDLQVFDEPTLDAKGRVVERSFAGRLKRLRSSLVDFFEFLKQENRWNSSYIFLVGLNGHSELERFSELPTTNLHVENTQVAMLIKPPQKSRDLGLSWKVDSNVALVDVAQTLFEIFGVTEVHKAAVFPSLSLVSALHSTETKWPEDRLIPIESSWAQWKGLGSRRFALRNGNNLVILDEVPKIFNTLTDRLELNPIGLNASTSGGGSEFWLEKINHAKTLLQIENWKPLPPGILHQVDVAMNMWDPSGGPGYVQQENEKDPTIAGWLSLRAVENRNWSQLLRLGKRHDNRFWESLANANLQGKIFFPDNNCLRGAKRPDFDSGRLKECGDSMFRNLLGWIKTDQGGGEPGQFREAFVRSYRNLLVDRRISQLNYVNGLSWDVSSVPTQGPVLAEVYLNYPENKKYLTQLQERLKTDTGDGDFFEKRF